MRWLVHFMEEVITIMYLLRKDLRYAFLVANNALFVIIVVDLLDTHVKALILVLQIFKRAIEWNIANNIGIPP